jgi:hypothetical protein
MGDIYEGPAPQIWLGGFGLPKFADASARGFDAAGGRMALGGLSGDLLNRVERVEVGAGLGHPFQVGQRNRVGLILRL